jgi:hypothetical protein
MEGAYKLFCSELNPVERYKPKIVPSHLLSGGKKKL